MAASAGTHSARRSTLSERMGDGVARVTWDSLDAAAIEKAKFCILDYMSCALDSHDLPWSRQAVNVASDDTGFDPAANATIIGTAHRVSTHDAAFANAVLGHGLVRDDMHVGSVSHLGTVIMPTLLALTDKRGEPGISLPAVTGKELLIAIICGYEVGGWIGRAILDVDVARIYRPTGITGPLGAAAAAAKLFSLDAAGIANAIGLAANTVAGYNEWAATGGSEMFFHTGFAARNALVAAELAAAGAQVSITALDGPAGLLAAFGKLREPALPDVFEGSAEILSVFFKPVPACNYAQSPAQAAQTIALRDRPDEAAVESVVVRVTEAAAHYPGCDAAGPLEHILQAKMSIQYNVAAALTKGNFDEANYRPAEQQEILRLAAATRLEIDPELTAAYPSRQGAEVIVNMQGGAVHRCRLDDVAAASNDEVAQRFSAAAAERCGREKAKRLLEFVAELETVDNAALLIRLTRTGAML